MSLTATLTNKGLATPPKWLPDSVQYETITGSQAYGMADDGSSDYDCYGFCIPPKELIFPHLAGKIPLFDFPSEKAMWSEYEQHHIVDPSANAGKGREYDLTIFSLVRYIALCAEGNPNLLDTLFTRHTEVLTCTPIGQMVRDARRMFLHRGCFAKFRGYATSQIHKMEIKAPEPGSRRAELVTQHGFDVKFGAHAIRLLLEAEQILTTGDLDLQRDKELLKEIRRGEWSLAQVKEYFAAKSIQLEALLAQSKLPAQAYKPSIKQLILDCLESHYGKISGTLVQLDRTQQCIHELEAVLERYRD